MLVAKKILVFATLGLLLALASGAQADPQACVYNRTVYPHGSQMCQGGTMMQCEEGAWAAMGFCQNEPMPEPISSGGDAMAPEEE